MADSSTLQPSPEVAAAAILVLAGSDQPQGVPEALDLLQSIGIGNGAAPRAASDPTIVGVAGMGTWRTTYSDLMLSPNDAVHLFSSHLWLHSPAESIRVGFDTLVDAINHGAGAPDDEDLKADGSRTAYWKRASTDIELYFYAARPPADAVVQIAVAWGEEMAPTTGP